MKQRDIKIDVLKGLLVIGMVYCHILQFFADLNKNPVAEYITWYINAVTFSGFVFTFGYTSYIAYFSKDLKVVWRKIIRTFFKLLAAFYISGIAFRVLVEHKSISRTLVTNILLLNDIPGWSEFIISFALYILVGAIFFGPLKKLLEHKSIFWIIVFGLLGTTFIPYEKITVVQLGLWIGSTKFASFPVLQYMPFYLIGMYFKRYRIVPNWRMILGSGILSGIGLVAMGLQGWQLPSRFPPSLFWIVLPSFPVVLYYTIGYVLERYEIPCGGLRILGQNSMVYLLWSNIIIFALSGGNGVRALNGITGFIGNVFLLGMITYLLQMSRPVYKKREVAG